MMRMASGKDEGIKSFPGGCDKAKEYEKENLRFLLQNVKKAKWEDLWSLVERKSKNFAEKLKDDPKFYERKISEGAREVEEEASKMMRKREKDPGDMRYRSRS